MTTETQPQSIPSFTHREILTIVFGLMLGMFLAALDQTIVSTAIRTIADDLHGFTMQAWATTAFLITSTITTPLYGKFSDIYGRRPFFLAAITIFITGSALCGLSQSMYELAIFRAIQGVGAGGLFSLAFTVIADIVPPRERSKYQGYFAAVFATSSVLGPVVGGLLAGTDSFLGVSGWRWIFYINVPVGIIALIVVARVLHIPHVRHDHRIDWMGAASLVLCLVPLLTVLEQGREWGWTSGWSLICFGLGIIGLVTFILAERSYKEEALLPPALFRIRTFSISGAASIITGIGMFGGMLLLPLYLQIVRGSSPAIAGLQTLPMVAGIMTGANLTGQVIARTGRYSRFPFIGAVCMVIAAFLFSLVGVDTPMPMVMALMLLFGFGLGLNMQTIIIAVQNAVPPANIGVGTSSVPFFRQIGGTIGAALMLSILFSTVGNNINQQVQIASVTPIYQQALVAHPDQSALLRSEGGKGLDDTSFLSKLDEQIALPFKLGFVDSMQLVFLIVGVVLVAGMVLLWFLPHVPLRKHAGAHEQMKAEASMH